MAKQSSFILFLKQSIPHTIWAIGISSLLMNAATAVMFSGTALYMKTVLGIGISTIGFLEAIVEAIAYAIRIFSGIVSDFLRKRKSVILCGFIFLTISKPILAFSKNLIQIFIARACDRIGNGIQASPRDALVGDVSPYEVKGACYGLRQSLAVIGSTLGGIFGIVVMKASGNDFEMMFLLAAIPAFLAVLVIIYFVKEPKQAKHKESLRRPIKIRDLKSLGTKFWVLMIIVMIFMLARFSEIFIALNACDNYGLNVAYGTAITVIYNLTSTTISYPSGKLSDRMNRVTVLLVGFIILLVAHLTIYSAANLYFIFLGAFFWGLQVGITQSILSVLVSDYVPKDLRGTGFGVYYFITAISTAVASMLAGFISESTGTESNAFLYGAILSGAAVLMLLFFRKRLSCSN